MTLTFLPLLCLLLAARGATAGSSSSDDGTLQLFLYQSILNNDFALLPASSPPSSAGGVVVNSASYVLQDPRPVGFARARPFNASVPLFAYFSAQRKDLQTTTKTLAQLNAHGGDYAPLTTANAPVAHVWPPGTARAVPDTPLAPLWLVFSDARQDAITSPLNPADVNALVRASPPSPFRSDGDILGYVERGECDLCHTSLSETFPSAGGPDCPYKCGPNESFMGGAFYYGKVDGMRNTPGSRAMQASILAAGDVLRSYNSSAMTESGTRLHVSFLYNCCYNDTAKSVIADVLANTPWEPRNVTFDRAAWRIDSQSRDTPMLRPPTHYSIIVLLDAASNARMERWVREVEQAVTRAGVPIHVPRSQQEPFHTTLGTADGTSFPVETALRRINELVAPGTWTGTQPVTLTKPTWA